MTSNLAKPAESAITLIECLLGHAARRPEDLAIYEPGAQGDANGLCWAELGQAAQGIARHLATHFQGYSVIIALSNSTETQIALLGALWSGAQILPVSPLTPESELIRQSRKLGKSLLVADSILADSLSHSFPCRLTSEAIAAGEFASDSDYPDKSLQSSILLQSSGTTGQPKLVCRGMRSLLITGKSLVRSIHLVPADRVLINIPLCHSYGIDMGLLAATVAGSELELHSRYSPGATRSALSEGRITVWPGVPLMFDTISRSMKAPAVHRLRSAISAGSPLPLRVYAQFLEGFKTQIGQLYGASEFGSAFYNSPELSPFDPAAVGHPLDGVDVKITSIRDSEESERAEVSLPAGAEGEIAIRAPTMMSHYIDAAGGPDSNGFLQTGDIGSVDERGILRISGRVKLLIDVGAQKVNPLEVESVFCQHPSVSEAVVLALPFSDTADRLKALVLPRPGTNVNIGELRDYLRGCLIPYKVPRIIEIRSDFPRSATGKILREVLQSEVTKVTS
ncbi:MAG: AMP-binding protein [Myxococcota bacterium]|nr:AMP-binding protein [Myxococcota bacterium]